MSKKIYDELTEDFQRRMRNWANSNAGAGLYAMTAAYSLARVRGGEIPMPLLIGEAEDTARALSDVPLRYRQAVMLFWQYEGRPLSWFAGRSGVGVDYRTFEARVIKGHDLLKAVLARQHNQWVEMRKQCAVGKKS